MSFILTSSSGSTTLYFSNINNQEQTIDIQQHVIKEYYEELSKNPGRVYLNNELIEKRSILESAILEYLKEFVVKKLKNLERDILTNQINWIKSKDYIELIPIKLVISEARRREYESNMKIRTKSD